MQTELIRCEDLVPSISGFEYAGTGLDLSVTRGQVVSILGPDYSGKSEWLNALSGVDHQLSGKLELLGESVDAFDQNGWVRARRELGFVRSDTAILSAANAVQNVVLPARYHGLGTASTLIQPAMDLLYEIGVTDLDCLPAYLRRDQRFKVALARALMLEPQALLLDGPFIVLDADATERLQSFLLRRVRQDELTLVLVTHDVNFAITNSDQIIFVTQEQVYHFDRENRIQDCEHEFVQGYLNKNRMTC